MPELKNFRHEQFCQAFVSAHPPSATQAYVAIKGWTDPTPKQRRYAARYGYELMERKDIQDRIKELRAEIARRNEVTQDELIRVFRTNIERANANPDNPKWGQVANSAATKLGEMAGLLRHVREKGEVRHVGVVRHEHHDGRVPLTQEERENRIRAILSQREN
jgi:hypothetical protein